MGSFSYGLALMMVSPVVGGLLTLCTPSNLRALPAEPATSAAVTCAEGETLPRWIGRKISAKYLSSIA